MLLALLGWMREYLHGQGMDHVFNYKSETLKFE